MDTRILGKTGLPVSALGFGAMHLPKIGQEEADRLLNEALDRGITYFDTAAAYGDGLSEARLGHAISHRRSEFVLNTKTQKRDYASALQDIENSLRELKTDYIDIVQIHYVNYVQEYRHVKMPEGAIRAVEEMKAKGYIGHIGISGHRPELLARWVKDYPFETVLFHLNMAQPYSRRDLIPTLLDENIGMIAMKPLSGPYLSQIRESLRYSYDSPVHVVLSGMKSLEELTMNLDAFSTPVSPEEQAFLHAMAEGLDESGCRRCNYCSCPLGIRIPDTLIPSRYRERY
ncbi:MAG: aldo/keto reductase, partial [Clostridia bacterium]